MHSEKAFGIAKKIADCLIESGKITKEEYDLWRGIIQIKMEED